MILEFDDELTLNQGPTTVGQLVTAAAIGGRQKGVVGQPRDWGAGEAVFAYFLVTPAAPSNPGTSMLVEIVAADNALLTTNVVVLSSRSVLTAALTAGAKFSMPSLQQGIRRAILGCRFTPSGANPTTGAYVCGLIRGQARQQSGGMPISGSVSW